MEEEVQERVAKIEEAVQRANAAHNARKEALLAKTRKIEEDKKSAAARSGHQNKTLLYFFGKINHFLGGLIYDHLSGGYYSFLFSDSPCQGLIQ